ncbi:hypothetical protein [Dyella amyloliquefaciens]|uniref:hypothetical protein n=1 Tax=Dyella amyloliquefaciens TaxID=1770545 RepID=UPI00197AA1BB|nr:hypothetical protein [Dyella amyloliquefaciens]
MNGFRAVCLATLVAFMFALIPTVHASQDTPKSMQGKPDLSGLHDFDFLQGNWTSHHRKLKERLANSHDWEEFDGTLSMRELMDGHANVDDNVFKTAEGTYRGVGLRSYDPKTAQWAIWWLDGRDPFGQLDPPVKGHFENGVGTFYSTDTLRGKPVRVRFIWSKITRTTAHWEQAYSADDGKTWEVNWVMDFTRVP